MMALLRLGARGSGAGGGLLPLLLTTRCLSSSAGTPSDVYDVVIVGSGMVGSTLAALLGSQPLTSSLRVALLDHSPPPSAPPPPGSVPELRVSTIVPSSAATLQRAGAWGPLAPPASAQFTEMQVWDAAGPGHIRWSAAQSGLPAMGWVVENNMLTWVLAHTLQQQQQQQEQGGGRGGGGGVQLMWPASVSQLELPPYRPKALGSGQGLATVTLDGGRRLQARLVVAADGGGSRVRQLAGLRTSGWAYGQRGVVATVATAQANSDTAWQRFLPTGPLALLPVRDGYSNIVWSTTPDMAAALQAMPPRQFAQAVNTALGSGSGSDDASSLAAGYASAAAAALLRSLPAGERFEAPPQVEAWVGQPPQSFPLQLRQAGRYVLPRLALVGDAAHTVHPLAGQGVNLGLADVEALAQALAYAVERGQDLGDAQLLQERYGQPRQRANEAMAAALDALQRGFALQAAPLGLLRSTGLGLLNAARPVKSRIMQLAMGMQASPNL